MTKAIQLAGGEYYIAVQSTNAKKGGAAYYNVTLNTDGCSDLPEAFLRDLYVIEDADNGWNNYVYDQKSNMNPSVSDFVTTVIWDEEAILLDNNSVDMNGYRNYVGYGDAFDYAKIELNYAAKLSFTVSSTDAVKFSVCQPKSNGKGGYSLNPLATATLTAGGTTSTGNVLLDAGTYYVSMESTNAAKGGDAYYNLSVGKGLVFFMKGNNDDDWTDMKQVGEYSAQYRQESFYDDLWFDDWVGYGDEIDYMRVSLDQDTKVSFYLFATDEAKFTVWELVSTTGRTGVTSYSLKSLLSVSLNSYNDVRTNALQLNAGDYYLSMESTNAAQGGDADYFIEMERATDEIAMPESMAYASAADVLAQDDGLFSQMSGLLV